MNMRELVRRSIKIAMIEQDPKSAPQVLFVVVASSSSYQQMATS